jgi:predicted acetyltransferase
VTVRLRPLRPDDEQPARAAQAELAAEGFTFLLDWHPGQPWADYLAQMAAWEQGLHLPADRVRASFLVAEAQDTLVGRVSIRYELNDFLAAYGGHIGYAVRPAHRRRGFASEILNQALNIIRAHGVDRVLVTCDEDNVGSAKVIERQGGVFEDSRLDPRGIYKRRYWLG